MPSASERAATPLLREEDGFTLIEMIIAMTLLAFSLMALAQMTFGAMSALQATRQRTVFLERATAEMERIRALPYDDVCVESGDLTPAYDAGGTFEGRPAAVGTPCGIVPVTSNAATDAATAHTVRRWVTYTDTAGGTGSSTERFKRLTVELDWSENGKTDRTIRLASVLYPGGLGDGPLGNLPPVAVGTATPSTGILAGADLVAFDSAGSSDPDGGTLTYEWSFGDGSPTVSGPTASHVYATAGGYTARLKVTDDQGGVDFALIPVSVSSADGNNPPVPDLVATSPTTGVAPLVVTFDVSGSYDPDPGDSVVDHTIDWGDGSSTSGVLNASHEFTTAGSFTVVLTVTDTGGLTSSTSLLVTTTPLDCAITEGFFRNPSSNSVANDIELANSDRPKNSAFTFRATTNPACSSLTVSLPKASGSIDVTMSLDADAGGVRSWSGSANTNDKFSRGAGQVGVFTATGSSGTVQRSYTYTAD